MDTKLTKIKENKANLNVNKLFHKPNFIFLLVLLVVSIAMVGCYAKIKNDVNKYYITSYRKNTLTNKVLRSTNYVLYKDAIDIEEGGSKDANDIFIKQSDEPSEDDEYYSSIKNSVQYYLDRGKESIDQSYKSLDYDVLDTEGNVVKSNTESELSKLVETNDTKALNNKYLFYITIKYDENGQVDVENVYGAAKNKAIDDLNQEIIKSDITGFDECKKYLVDNPIKNITFVYGVKKDYQYWDLTQNEMKEDLKEVYDYVTSSGYIIVLVIVIGMLSLLIPFELEKEVILSKKAFKVPFDILFILLSITIACISKFASKVMQNSINGHYVDYFLAPKGIGSGLGNFLVLMFNLVYWMIFASVIFISVVTIKSIFRVGLVKYFKEAKLVIFRNMFATKLDLSNRSTRIILKVIGINFVIILGSGVLFWAVLMAVLIITDGIITFPWISIAMLRFLMVIGLMFVYSLLLFCVLKRYYCNISGKFMKLLDITNKISEGNFEVKTDENLGMFNPLKDKISMIQNGFKKAVEEEVRSQRMKTELISNVSHDLKTPLTSIITYVDLLKGENLTEEERKSYLDTLDKKSQRLKYLIEDLFEVSKATSGNIALNIVKVDVVELMKQTQIELEDKINKVNLDIRNNFPKERVILDLDSQKTFRIFENLLINVVKYAMKGSRAYIDILDGTENVEITMKNMSAEEINFNSKDIVERFERGDKSRNTEGSGLGLAIVKSFVEVQGGKFDLEVDGDLFKVIILFKKI